MTAMPIKAMVPPTAIKNQPNGAVPDDLLEQVDEKTGYMWKLASLPARGMRAMHADIHTRFGVQMTSVGRGRSFPVQKSTFEERHTCVTLAVFNATPKLSGVANKRVWPDAPKYGHATVYFVLKRGMASAAVPGTSPHGLWCADDMALPGPTGISARPDILDWLYLHEHEYGFAHSLTSEPWHVQWVNGDVVPARVLAFEGQHPVPAPEQPPVFPPPTIPEDDMPTNLHVTCPGKPELLVSLDGSGATLLGFSSPDDRDTLVAATRAVAAPVSAAQYDQLVALARGGDGN